MKTAFDTAFDIVQELVQTFESNRHAYLSADYSEAQVRKDFIDKLFIALGWDVNHDIQKNPYEQEVKVEPPVIIGATQRHADFAFRLAPNFHDVLFFVEAKKPSNSIATKENYFQVIRYGWNSQTPLAVLTDFQQFHVIDCRFKPDPDTALKRAIATYSFTDYKDREKFAFIYWLFSREAVAAGSLQKRASELPKPRGKVIQHGLFPGAYKSVDDSFLEQLDEFRTDLARAFKAIDPDFDGDTLTELTQRTLDRLVFLRFLEDKGIEIHYSIDKFGSSGTVWEDFIAACHRLDGIYNGIVFKRHSILDAQSFNVEDNVFGRICEQLASVNTPYDFNSIPIHILGSIYERFLGNVIVTTAKRARIEAKPGTRKAGGVYYTPEYISRYIVSSTVGKIIAGKTPSTIAKMRFADISCGSGSFLLCIYDLLLQYHGSYYNNLSNSEKTRAVKIGDCIEREGKLYLSLRKKREILLNNIYGVDIDTQAVEVTQLSLFLRLLQEETTVSARQYLLEFEHVTQMKKLLPDLSKNIVCGNSLVGTDILEGQLFPRKEERKLNAMNFEDAFPEIMKNGGFDAIVGNPPWISLSGKFRNDVLPKSVIDYLIHRYQGNTYMPNMYEYFVHQGLRLTRESGYFSYVVPDRLGFNSQFVNLRKQILDESIIISLAYKVPFPGITADTLIFVVQKSKVRTKHLITIFEHGHRPFQRLQSDLRKDSDYKFEYFENPEVMNLVNKINNIKNVSPLSSFCDSTSGFGGKSQLISPNRINKNQIPTFKGDSIGRYELHKQYWFEFKKQNITGRTTDTSKLGTREKVLIRKTGDRIIATYDESGVFPEQSLYFLYNNRNNLSFKFLLGVLNSRLLNAYYRARSLTNKQSIAQVKKVDLDQLPIAVLDLNNTDYEAKYRGIVTKVDAILEAKQQLAIAKTDKDKTYYENKCAALDRQIDLIVYDIYGLTEKEINLVETLDANTYRRVSPSRSNTLPLEL